jgi:hypothetical protein
VTWLLGCLVSFLLLKMEVFVIDIFPTRDDSTGHFTARLVPLFPLVLVL